MSSFRHFGRRGEIRTHTVTGLNRMSAANWTTRPFLYQLSIIYYIINLIKSQYFLL
jgi:hypothetical protein